MDFVKSYTFVFEDPDWFKKLGLVALVSIIPIIGTFVALGWALEAGRRLIRRTQPVLPELDFGAQLGLGFQSFLIGLVYSIPAIILYLPLVIVPAVIASTSSDQSSSAGSGVAMVVSLCCGGLLLLYGLVMMVLIPAAHGNFLSTGQMSSAFNFKEIISLIRAAPGSYLLVLLGGIIGGIIAPLGGIACGVGVVLTYTYVMVVTGHLYAQAYLSAINNGALR
jgi:hypothetical protein